MLLVTFTASLIPIWVASARVNTVSMAGNEDVNISLAAIFLVPSSTKPAYGASLLHSTPLLCNCACHLDFKLPVFTGVLAFTKDKPNCLASSAAFSTAGDILVPASHS